MNGVWILGDRCSHTCDEASHDEQTERRKGRRQSRGLWSHPCPRPGMFKGGPYSRREKETNEISALVISGL